MEKNLPEALSESLKEDSVDTLSDVLEVGIDAFLDEGVIRDIPILSMVIGIYRTGKSINDLYLLKKLKVFVCAINDGIASEEVILKYKNKLQDNPKKRQQELEYILVLINRYINLEKPEMLAKLYLAYIDEIITWDELTIMSEIIDRFLPGDYDLLKSNHDISIINDKGTENALRLISSGLLIDTEPILKDDDLILNCGSSDDKDRTPETRNHNYSRTRLGDKMTLIIG